MNVKLDIFSQEKGTEADAEGGPSDAQSELENPQSVQLEEFEAEAACPEEHVPGINEGGKDQKFSSEPEKASGKTYKIFVSNLPPGLCSSELQELFEPYGKVAECEIFAKNYAFVVSFKFQCLFFNIIVSLRLFCCFPMCSERASIKRFLINLGLILLLG